MRQPYAELRRAIASGEAVSSHVTVINDLGVNKQDEEGWTLLHQAVSMGNRAAVVDLLKMGAGSNIVDLTGLSPRDYAVLTGNDAIISEVLKYAGPRQQQEF